MGGGEIGQVEEEYKMVEIKEETLPAGSEQSDMNCVGKAGENSGSNDHEKMDKGDIHSFKECGKECKTVQQLNDHDSQEHGETFKCGFCENTFKDKGAWCSHVIIAHTKQRYSCNSCSKQFSSKQKLSIHKNIHLGLKPFQCDKCESSFRNSGSLSKHKRKHISPEVTCPVCEKGVYKEANLKSHMKKHTWLSALKVSKAERAEAVAMARLIGITRVADELNINPDALRKWFKLETNPVSCNQCDHITFSESKLGEHMKTHGTGKIIPQIVKTSFMCVHCGFTSTRKISLVDHERSRHGIGPAVTFQCCECEKEFHSRGGLRKHTKDIHTGRRYPCNHCSHKAKQNIHLKSHIQKFHAFESSNGTVLPSVSNANNDPDFEYDDIVDSDY